MYVDVYGNCAICSVSKDNYVGNGVDVKYLAVTCMFMLLGTSAVNVLLLDACTIWD